MTLGSDAVAESSPLADVDLLGAKKRRTGQYVGFVAAGLLPVFLAPEHMWGVPSIVMFLYLYFGLREAERTDLVLEFADSFYYMGFTLSVGALLASLHPFEPSRTTDAEEALRFFGLGMLTTLIGVVGRTALQLFYRTPGESAEAANRRIQESTSEFLIYLDQLKGRSLEQLQSIGDEAVALRASVRRNIAAIEEATTEMKDRLAKANQVADSVAEPLRKVIDAFSAISDHLKEIETVTQAWENTSEQQFETAQRVLEALERSTQRFTRTTEDVIRALREAAEGAHQLQVGTGGAFRNLQLLATSASESAQAFDELTEPSTGAAGSLQSLTSAASELASEFNRVAKNIPSGAAFGELKERLGELSGAFLELRKRLVADDGGASSTTGALVEVERRAKRLNVVINEIVEAIGDRVAAIQ